jgi:hypothetical protein
MIETILLVLLIAKVKKYEIKPLFRSWAIYPVLSLELIYFIFQINIFLGNYSFIQYSAVLKIVYLSSYLFLILKYEQYIAAIIGSIFIFIGSTLNNIAIKVNGGKMPVFPSLSYATGYAKPDVFAKVNDIHILGSSTTSFKFLTDIFDLGYSILSIGDIFIRFFVFIIIFNSIKYTNNFKNTYII